MNIFFTILVQPLANGLAVFYRLLGQNLGLSILGFSVFLRFILTPLTRPYMESMKRMKKYAPHLEKLKRRHKGDQKKLLEAQSQFYKEKGIKPGAGCLPYILQIIVLIAFYNVFNRILVSDGNIVEHFNELLYEPLKFASDTVVNPQFLFWNLTVPDVINIPFWPNKLPGVLVILSAIVQLLSVMVTRKLSPVETAVADKTKEKGDDMQVAMQNSMVYTMPLLTLWLGLRFSAGLVLYWFVISIFNALQQIQAADGVSLGSLIGKANLLKLPEGQKNETNRKKSK